MLTPRASFGLEEPFPDDEPTSDAPCHPAGTPASAPCQTAAVSMRIPPRERSGASRIHPRNQDVSEIDRLRPISSASGAPTVVSRHHRFRGGWILVADSTPQTSIAHPFTSIPPSVRVNGAMGSFVARGPAASRLSTKTHEPRRCVRPTDAIHTISTSTRVPFGDRPHRTFARGFGVWRASRRSARFGDCSC